MTEELTTQDAAPLPENKSQPVVESEVISEPSTDNSAATLIEATGMEMPRHHQEAMERYYRSKENHIPGKIHELSDTTYMVSPSGAWHRSQRIVLDNPNMKNKSVRKKLTQRPKKYLVANS